MSMDMETGKWHCSIDTYTFIYGMSFNSLLRVPVSVQVGKSPEGCCISRQIVISEQNHAVCSHSL